MTPTSRTTGELLWIGPGWSSLGRVWIMSVTPITWPGTLMVSVLRFSTYCLCFLVPVKINIFFFIFDVLYWRCLFNAHSRQFRCFNQYCPNFTLLIGYNYLIMGIQRQLRRCCRASHPQKIFKSYYKRQCNYPDIPFLIYQSIK